MDQPDSKANIGSLLLADCPTITIFDEGTKPSHTVKPNIVPKIEDKPPLEDFKTEETSNDSISKEEIANMILEQALFKDIVNKEPGIWESNGDIKKEEIKDEEGTDGTDDDEDDVIEIKKPHVVIEVSSDEGDSSADFISLAPYKLEKPLQKCRKGISNVFQRKQQSRRGRGIKKRKLNY
ncbi:uncharacterized protein LOC118271937 [Spodoptera frugiperda]|uniref:Uncharacterized protein LOC118271937 n=1 Tax=Spodoptera frugiperda TaxID=7108 RepID=A0A9R0D872_SPOFR|nr:uncharacterized protein LOC118271937 [Spodoptera frugiperda]